MDGLNIPLPTKKTIFLFGILVFLGIGCWWIYSKGYIEIRNENENSFSATIFNQKNNEPETAETTSGNIKKLVGRGNYQVTVWGESGSYFKVLRTGGFLQTTKLESKLQPEKKRSFIGSNPGPCMYYTGSLLYSYSCVGTTLEDLQAHIPASMDSATLTKTGPQGVSTPILGLIRVGGIDMFAAQVVGDEISQTKLYPISPDFSLSNGQVLIGLDGSTPYLLKEYLDGFIVYTESYENILYYENASSKPENINIKPQEEENLKPILIDVNGSRIARVYSSMGVESENLDSEHTSDGSTVIQVFDRETKETNSYTFDRKYTGVKLCGKKEVCLLRDKKLEIYTLKGSETSKLYEVDGVLDVGVEGQSLFLTLEEGLLRFDIANASGHFMYTFGDFEWCGGQPVKGGGYALCIIDTKENRSALYIKDEESNVDSVDKKYLDLVENPSVDFVSVYGKFVYISPYTGDLIYNPSVRGFNYDPQVVADSNEKLRKGIDETDLMSNGYIFTNPYSK